MWCSTCGKDTEEDESECPSCAEFWKNNPPPPRRVTGEEIRFLRENASEGFGGFVSIDAGVLLDILEEVEASRNQSSSGANALSGSRS